MSDKQAAVIYRRVTRSANGFAIREETTLVFFRSWSRYFSSMCFHVFFDKLSNKLLWLFFLFLSFYFRWNSISSILKNELKQFASGAVLSFAQKKKTQLASNFKLTRTPTIYGEHGYISSYTIMAKPINMLELHYPMIQFLINIYISSNLHILVALVKI